MTDDEMRDLLDHAEFEPRYVANVLAIDSNVETLMEYAAAHGQSCHFWTFTFKTVEDMEQCAKDWSEFLRRLRGKTKVCGMRVFEWGRTTGRFHVHAVFDRYVSKELVDYLKRDLVTMGHSKISKFAADENLGRYLWKELTKQFRRRREFGRRRLWAVFGKLAAFVGANDCVVETVTYMDGVEYKGGFWKHCKRLAWEMRVTGESRRQTWERAWWMYTTKLWGRPIPPYGGWSNEESDTLAVEHGDAYEEAGGGDVEFNPSE